jgi:hypothetical protein
MSEEEKNAFENLENIVEDLEDAERGAIINLSQEEINGLKLILSLVKKQQKLINIFISNEAVREDKDFNEIKEKYYECL